VQGTGLSRRPVIAEVEVLGQPSTKARVEAPAEWHAKCNHFRGRTAPMPERLILVVEDEPSVSSVFTELLEAAGFAVTACAAYPEAAFHLEVQRPAVLVTDIVLPGGSGLELAALAEKLGVPTLLVSGHPDHITRKQLGGAVKFLAKPFAMTELEAALRDLLDPTRNRDRTAPRRAANDRDCTGGLPLCGGG
jgi:DNA-binding NtrC family response regulator